MADEGDVTYFEVETILRIHANIFDVSVDEARDRVLKPEGLASVVQRPESYAYYQNADLALQAAVLAHGIAESQLFVDGNKRTALEAMRLFLDVNGVSLTATQNQLAQWMLDLASGLQPEALAERVRDSDWPGD
jgi:death on curing protein